MNVGVDEAGRGCVFGPVYAAAVIWNNEITHDFLKDSKTVTKKRREYMNDFIKENALDYSVAFATSKEVDEKNILQATQLAMHRALDGLRIDFDTINVDGNYFNTYYSNNAEEYKSHNCIIKGDSKFIEISAASILAKVAHDEYICSIADQYSVYNLQQNMGYCTKYHIEAIKAYGRTFEHRHTFKMPYEKNM